MRRGLCLSITHPEPRKIARLHYATQAPKRVLARNLRPLSEQVQWLKYYDTVVIGTTYVGAGSVWKPMYMTVGRKPHLSAVRRYPRPRAYKAVTCPINVRAHLFVTASVDWRPDGAWKGSCWYCAQTKLRTWHAPFLIGSPSASSRELWVPWFHPSYSLFAQIIINLL